MKLQAIDENYLNEEEYTPLCELSREERKRMEERYLELLPQFINKPEKLLNNGSCLTPMDILHNSILNSHETSVYYMYRTEITKGIREAKKVKDYLSTQTIIHNQTLEFDVKEYVSQHNNSLLKVFNKVTT